MADQKTHRGGRQMLDPEDRLVSAPCSVCPPVLARLERLAKETATSVSAVIRTLIRQGLARLEGEV